MIDDGEKSRAVLTEELNLTSEVHKTAEQKVFRTRKTL